MSAVGVVQRQVETYNAQDLEAFLACFADDCVLGDVNGRVIQDGMAAIRTRYQQLFAQYPQNNARIVNRIAVGSVVIDHEEISRSPDERFEAVAIYAVRNDKISWVGFTGGEGDENAAIVQRQLDAYNAQDLDAMCACYTNDCVFAELNGEIRQRGRESIRARYAETFAQYPQNRARAANRIALGSYVIDDEQGERAPGVDPFRVAAVYTIQGGLIARCDFAR